RGKVQDYYDTAYRALSLEAHVLPRSVDKQLVPIEGGVVEIEWRPSDRALPGTLASAVDILLRSLRDAGGIFSIDVSGDVLQFQARLDVLVESMLKAETEAEGLRQEA